MKRLKNQIDLRGKIEEITISDFRKCPGDVFDQVECGKTFIIMRNRKALAVLSEVPGVQLYVKVNPKGQIGYDL